MSARKQWQHSRCCHREIFKRKLKHSLFTFLSRVSKWMMQYAHLQEGKRRQRKEKACETREWSIFCPINLHCNPNSQWQNSFQVRGAVVMNTLSVAGVHLTPLVPEFPVWACKRNFQEVEERSPEMAEWWDLNPEGARCWDGAIRCPEGLHHPSCLSLCRRDVLLRASFAFNLSPS